MMSDKEREYLRASEEFQRLRAETERAAQWDRLVREQIRAIVARWPVFPGDTLCHKTANECIRRGWAKRNKRGEIIPTFAGIEAAGRTTA